MTDGNMAPVSDILNLMKAPTEKDRECIIDAYNFGKEAHKGHLRKSGEPYFIHPIEVAKTLAEIGMTRSVIIAGLLHDAIEDAMASEEEVGKKFGDDVLFLVNGVTKLGTVKYRGMERHIESLRKLLVATSQDVRVLIIKFADRLHNMKTLEHVSKEKQKRIAAETLQVYAPIAERLGIGALRKELEDLAFPYVHPKKYKDVLELRKQKNKDTEKHLDKALKSIKKELARAGITKFRTEIRIKGLYSLFKKLERKGKDIDRVYDISAIRVIVKSVDDCYKVLGVIHNLWRPLPGRIKDYIASPKPNGYQSLHTTVIIGDGTIIEIQIRTEKMHITAQYGIASHMLYKDGLSPKRGELSWFKQFLPGQTPSVEIKEAPAWIHDIAAMDEVETEEFFKNLKSDFFNFRIFVFTPTGDVIDLPADSTPIDFAYAVHSDIGDHVSGAKIGSKLVSLNTKLKNGDIIEIITKSGSHPTAKWLESAKTSVAQRKIQAYLNKPK